MASFAIKSLFFQKTVYFPLNSYAFVLTIRDPLGARWCDIFQFLSGPGAIRVFQNFSGSGAVRS